MVSERSWSWFNIEKVTSDLKHKTEYVSFIIVSPKLSVHTDLCVLYAVNAACEQSRQKLHFLAQCNWESKLIWLKCQVCGEMVLFLCLCANDSRGWRHYVLVVRLSVHPILLNLISHEHLNVNSLNMAHSFQHSFGLKHELIRCWCSAVKDQTHCDLLNTFLVLNKEFIHKLWQNFRETMLIV